MRDLTNGNEAKLIIAFSIPLLVGNIFQQLYSTVDAMAVGLKIGKEALAAVGVSTPLVFFMISIIMGITMGGGVVLSQYYGAKDFVRLRKAMHSTYLFLLIASVIVTVLGFILAEPVLRLIGTPAEYLEPASTFLRITFVGMVFVFGYNAISSVLRSLGDSKTPLYFLIFASVLNIVLVLFFVFTLGWGIAGSAWATVIAQGVAFAISLVYVQRSKNAQIHISLKELRMDPAEMKKILGMSVPSAIQMGLVSLSFVALNTIINPYGTDVMAGYTAAGRLDAFAILPAMNLSLAMATFAGQNMGAGKTGRVSRGLVATLFLGAGISLLITAAFTIFPTPLIHLFEHDPQVVHYGVQYLTTVSPFYIVFSGLFIITGLLRGAGAATFSMIATVVGVWAARVPSALGLAHVFGPAGIWWGIPIGWTVGLGLVLVYYFLGSWRKIDVVGHHTVIDDEGMMLAPNLMPTESVLSDECGDGNSSTETVDGCRELG